MLNSKPLPDSPSSNSGGTAGSMGDASKADLDAGFTKLNEGKSEFEPITSFNRGGFLGRANGWER